MSAFSTHSFKYFRSVHIQRGGGLASLVAGALLVLASTGMATAAGDIRPSQILSLTQEAIVLRALAHNPGLQGARTVVDQAEGRLIQAGRLENPELNVSYAGDQAFNASGEQNFSLGFAQKFPITHRLKLEKSRARDAVEMARAEIANEARILRMEVELAVLALAETEAALQLRAQLSALNREFLSFIESRIETGEASAVEANRLRLELYAMEQDSQTLLNQRAQQAAAVRELAGMAHEQAFHLDYTFSLPQTAPELPVFNQAMLERHPAYQMRQLLLTLADNGIAMARADRWADVAVEVLYEDERSEAGLDGIGRNRFFGVGLSIPLPLHDRKGGLIAERQGYRREMHWQLKSIAASLCSEAATQRLIVERIYEQASHYEAHVITLVDENLKVMNAAYSAGQISLTDLFRTQEQSLQIQTTQLTQLRELAESLSKWRAATAGAVSGTKLQGLESGANSKGVQL